MTSKIHSPLNDVSRRSVLGLFAAGGAFALTRRPVAAATAAEAEQLILKVVGEVQALINSGRSEAEMIKSFEGIFRNYGHVQTIARSLLGPSWKSASDSEKQAYVAALQGYLSRKYGKQFRSFIGASIKVTKSDDFGRKGIIVESVVSSPKFADTKVEWHVVEAGGQLRFFDMYVAGVKLISTERAEIRALLDRNGGDVGRLAEALKSLG